MRPLWVAVAALALTAGSVGAQSDRPGTGGSAGLPGGADRSAAWTSEKRVVVVDAGHGGRDLGALGLGGVREKDVALDAALALARALEATGLDVRLTREDDRFIPVWDRGPLANELKGDVPGLFISLHANSNPVSATLRGFETFFLAEARTEHEQRLAAMENTPPASVDEERLAPDTDLSWLLDDLRNRDTQHWSAHLAGLVQAELARFHPGPDRGVSQAPLAVITNTVMPSVLVEIGYISNADEAALLTTPEFHRQMADAIAQAVAFFFEDYPPGSGLAPPGSRE